MMSKYAKHHCFESPNLGAYLLTSSLITYVSWSSVSELASDRSLGSENFIITTVSHRPRLWGKPGFGEMHGLSQKKSGKAHAFIRVYHIAPQNLGFPTNIFDKSTPVLLVFYT